MIKNKQLIKTLAMQVLSMMATIDEFNEGNREIEVWSSTCRLSINRILDELEK